MNSKYFILLMSLFLFAACNSQSTEKIENVAPVEFAQKLKTGDAQLIDVRTPEEYNTQHLHDAVNINWNGDDFETRAAKLDKSKPVLVYCKVGGRSQSAAEKLSEMGFKQVYNLEGGIMKWNAAGMPSAKAEKSESGMSQADFQKLISDSNKPVLIDFYAQWCAPCKKMEPYLLKMESEEKGKIKIVRIDADKNRELIDALKIDGLPTLILYEDSKQIWRHTGFISEADLKKQIK